MSEKSFDELIAEAKTDFERGYVDGLVSYSYASSAPWAENGVLYVGTGGTKLKDAIRHFLDESRGSRVSGVDFRAIPPDGSSGIPDRDEVRKMIQEEVARFARCLIRYAPAHALQQHEFAIEAYLEGRNPT